MAFSGWHPLIAEEMMVHPQALVSVGSDSTPPRSWAGAVNSLGVRAPQGKNMKGPCGLHLLLHVHC